MKKVILLFCFMPVAAFCQVSYNFETASLQGWIQSAAGRWAADSASPVSGKYSLHHIFDNSEAGTDQAGTRLFRLNPALGTTRWSFVIRYGTDPSSSNSWAVFLMADNGPAEMLPNGEISGFTIGVNLAGYDDTVRLWKFRSGEPTAVMTLPVNWQSDIGTVKSARIEAERTDNGQWNVTVSSGSLVRSASCTDPELFSPLWFGLYYKYTSTRDRLIWMDDVNIDGNFSNPVAVPQIVKITPAGRSAVDVLFDFAISPLSAIPSNFSCLPSLSVVKSIVRVDQRKFRVTFQEGLQNRAPCILVAKDICDVDSVCADTIKLDFTPAWAEPGDIMISEIMADPLPTVSLPGKEYLEISNTSGYGLGLNGLRLISGAEYASFPDSVIDAGDNIILCSATDTSLFMKYGKVIGLKEFPALTDDGRYLSINDESGILIHSVSYTKAWYGDILKSGGGWSLEMIDTHYPFFGEGNWKATSSPEGGTPGKKNSVAGHNPDHVFKGLVNVFPSDSITVLVTLSEPPGEPSKINSMVEVAGFRIDTVITADYPGMSFIVLMDHPMQKGKIYTLALKAGVTDHAGNKPLRNSFRFGLPVDASANEVTFNELLFNPLPGDGDYIELVNNSEKIFDVNRLYFVSLNDETADTSQLVNVSDTSRCFLPGSYYCLTTLRGAIINRYMSSTDTGIFEVERLPSMPDDKGHLLLFNSRAEKIDEVKYSEKMHFSLLSGFEGVALEKIRPTAESSDEKGWLSASETSGWGTPGAINSVYTETPISGNSFSFSSSRITPDNDGYEDALVIDLDLTGNSNIVTILIYDENGGIVRKLVQNLFCSGEMSVVWDGSADNGSLVYSGIYVVLIRVFDETGKTIRWKKACAVIR